jgi:hypothetical protein
VCSLFVIGYLRVCLFCGHLIISNLLRWDDFHLRLFWFCANKRSIGNSILVLDLVRDYYYC